MDANPVRILGEAEQKIFTLDDCLLTKRQSDFNTVTREEYQPSLVLSGAHFDDDEVLNFSDVRFKISNVAAQIGISEVLSTETSLKSLVGDGGFGG